MSVNEAKKSLEERIRAAFCDADQGHVFSFWDDLGDSDQRILLEQLDAVDLELLARLIDEHVPGSEKTTEPVVEPAPVIRTPSSDAERAREGEALTRGLEQIAAGGHGVLLVAGGQGSRLGFDGPKGLFPVGPVSNKCLFQVHGEKILALSRRFGVRVPLYVMTSQTNHEATVEGFEKHDFFGLSRDDVFFFQQGMLPAVGRDGRLVLTDKGRIFMSPDGHGGCLRALHSEGILDRMKEEGIHRLFYFQVDNPLVHILDPVFVGYHHLESAQMSLKWVRKRDPGEKVGVFANVDGRPSIIEYSDMPEPLQSATRDDGSPLFDAGNIAIHLIEREFIEELTAGGDFRLPFHRALKAIEALDEKGQPKKPEEPNGIKFETFIFDALPRAERVVAMEILRQDEFSPVKNATGVDSPAQARADMSSMFRRWLSAAGYQLEDTDAAIEISPLFALDQDELVDKVRTKSQLGGSRLWIS